MQMKGNYAFNFLHCSCPVPHLMDGFLLCEHYQFCVNPTEVSAKCCRDHTYCSSKFDNLPLSTPFFLPAFCRNSGDSHGLWNWDRVHHSYRQLHFEIQIPVYSKKGFPSWTLVCYQSGKQPSGYGQIRIETYFTQSAKGKLFLDWAKRECFFCPLNTVALAPLLNWIQTLLSDVQNGGRKQKKGFLSWVAGCPPVQGGMRWFRISYVPLLCAQS